MEVKSILITGCSSGIGLCAATLLKNRGYRVFATARKPADVESLSARGFESFLLDVNDRDSMKKTVNQILSLTHGKLYGLFNNSGYLAPGAIEDLNQETERSQFETNVFGPMELIRLVLPAMRKQGTGRIIQNSSILGIVTLPFCGVYNASKFALEGFSNTLRQELHGSNIFVSIINPGPIASKFRDHALEHYSLSLKDQASKSVYAKTYAKMEASYFTKKKDIFMIGPEAVVKKVILALESRRPKAHYFVGIPAHALAFLRRILPDRWLDWILIKIRQ